MEYCVYCVGVELSSGYFLPYFAPESQQIAGLFRVKYTADENWQHWAVIIAEYKEVEADELIISSHYGETQFIL